jgi:valienol-1-phosphate guanylyltransferase
VFTAFCLFRAEVLQEYLTSLAGRGDDGWQHDISRDVLPAMIEDGRHVLAYPISGYWADIGTVERYHLEQLRLLDRPYPMPPEHLPRTLAGAPPRFAPHLGSLIGENADPPPDAVVRESLLFPGCVIEPGAEVRRSVVLPGARVRSGVRLSEAVAIAGEDVTDSRTGLADLEPAQTNRRYSPS